MKKFKKICDKKCFLDIKAFAGTTDNVQNLEVSSTAKSFMSENTFCNIFFNYFMIWKIYYRKILQHLTHFFLQKWPHFWQCIILLQKKNLLFYTFQNENEMPFCQRLISGVKIQITGSKKKCPVDRITLHLTQGLLILFITLHVAFISRQSYLMCGHGFLSRMEGLKLRDSVP